MSQAVLAHLIDQQQEVLALLIRKTEIDVLIEDTIGRMRNYLAMSERMTKALEEKIRDMGTTEGQVGHKPEMKRDTGD